MSENDGHRPKLGLQGPVLAWQDPWARSIRSINANRNRDGNAIPRPLARPESYTAILKELGTEFYVHHMFPDLSGQAEILDDMVRSGIEVCLGNEYGNINGPFVQGTNRYDVPDEAIITAASSGKLIGLLYDEPEHLQINAGQYRKDGWFPHWGENRGSQLVPIRAAGHYCCFRSSEPCA